MCVCVCLSVSQPYLLPYRDKLKRLISEQTFREEMATFHLLPSASTILPSHRYPLSAVLIRCLLPKLLKRTTTQSKSTLASRRAAVCSYLGGLSGRELEPLLSLLLQPFGAVLSALCAVERQVLVRSNERVVALDSAQAMQSSEGVLYECVPNAAFWSLMLSPTQLHQALSAASASTTAPSAAATPTPTTLFYHLTHHQPPLATRIGLFKLLQHVLSQLRHVIGPYVSVVCALVVVCGVSAQWTLDRKRATNNNNNSKATAQQEAVEVEVDEEGREKEVEEVAEEEEEEVESKNQTSNKRSMTKHRSRSHSRSGSGSTLSSSSSSDSSSSLEGVQYSRSALNEQRTIRQLCYSRMAQMMDLFHEQFSAGLTLNAAPSTTTTINLKTRYCALSFVRFVGVFGVWFGGFGRG